MLQNQIPSQNIPAIVLDALLGMASSGKIVDIGNDGSPNKLLFVETFEPPTASPTTSPTSSSPTSSPLPFGLNNIEQESTGDSASKEEVLTVVDITVSSDRAPEETSFVLQKKTADNDWLDIVRMSSLGGDSAGVEEHYTTSATLGNGDYRFIIFDSGRNGICCDNGNGYYLLSQKVGIRSMRFASGSEFGSQATTTFSVQDGSVLNVEA